MKIHYSILFSIITFSSGCNQSAPTAAHDGEKVTAVSQQARDTEDLTDPELFTSGIEGPAVSSEGDIYVVNFETQGTIGKWARCRQTCGHCRERSGR